MKLAPCQVLEAGARAQAPLHLPLKEPHGSPFTTQEVTGVNTQNQVSVRADGFLTICSFAEHGEEAVYPIPASHPFQSPTSPRLSSLPGTICYFLPSNFFFLGTLSS